MDDDQSAADTRTGVAGRWAMRQRRLCLTRRRRYSERENRLRYRPGIVPTADGARKPRELYETGPKVAGSSTARTRVGATARASH